MFSPLNDVDNVDKWPEYVRLQASQVRDIGVRENCIVERVSHAVENAGGRDQTAYISSGLTDQRCNTPILLWYDILLPKFEPWNKQLELNDLMR